jgi:hypothetical protein
MGIEPTGHTHHAQPNGFEDRGHHQVCKHFLFYAMLDLGVLSSSILTLCRLAASRLLDDWG